MGTKVQSESYLPGYHSMRDLNEDSNSCSWSHYYGDKTLTNGQYYNSFFSRTIIDSYPEYNKDLLKRTMLEHEAIFKNQVSELHRLYRIQRELMDEIKKKDLQKNQIPIEPSLSSSLLASQITSEDAHKWHIPSFPLTNSLCGRPLISVVKDSHSPLSSVKGSNAQTGPFPSQNGGNSKDVEVVECRPTKVRRKMFDLQLPAEEYIDTKEYTASGISSYLPNGNGKIGPASGGKLFHEGKTDCLDNASRSDSCSRGKNSLADLNEPARIEETNGSAYSHFLGRELSAKPKQELLGLPKDIPMNFLWQSDDKSVTNVHVQKTGTTRGFFSDVVKPWSHSVFSWDKPSNNLSEKSTTVPAHAFLNSSGPSSKSSVISSRSSGIFGEKWQVSSNSRLSPSVGSGLPNRNGFYYGSSSGYKEPAIRFPSVSYDYPNFTSHGSTKPYNCSNSVDMKSTSGVNLNVVLSNSSSNELIWQRGPQIDGGRNHEDHLRGLPWLRAKPVFKNEATSAGRDLNVGELNFSQSSPKKSTDKGRHMLLDINLPCDVTLPDMNQEIVAENLAIEKEATNLSSFRHQFDLNSCVDEDEASFRPSVPGTGMKTIRGIDLEAPVILEPEDVIHGEGLLEKACESAQSKDDCIQDELVKIAAEAIVAISSYSQDGNSNDVDCNSSENSMTDPLNWFVETISSFGEDLERKFEALSNGKDGDRDESPSEEIDYFESMILKLTETREEDYMPEPLVPENFEVEETGASSLLTTRTRKGRRGRQRRDFQRDILPGLSSLSRLEVTEDLQTFGGLMRATGHSWHSGVTRRNSTRTGCGRGRGRSITTSSPALVAATTCMPLTQQLNNIEVGLENRSLTGWGKTTRRPRRQRCPTSNPPSIALT